jgi:hypothetical protein
MTAAIIVRVSEKVIILSSPFFLAWLYSYNVYGISVFENNVIRYTKCASTVKNQKRATSGIESETNSYVCFVHFLCKYVEGFRKRVARTNAVTTAQH